MLDRITGGTGVCVEELRGDDNDATETPAEMRDLSSILAAQS